MRAMAQYSRTQNISSIQQNHCVCNIGNQTSASYGSYLEIENATFFESDFECTISRAFKYVIQCQEEDNTFGEANADLVPLVILGIGCAVLLIFVFILLRKVKELKQEREELKQKLEIAESSPQP